MAFLNQFPKTRRQDCASNLKIAINCPNQSFMVANSPRYAQNLALGVKITRDRSNKSVVLPLEGQYQQDVTHQQR